MYTVMRFPRPFFPKHGISRPFPQLTFALFVPHRILTTSTLHSAPVDVPELIVAPGSKHHSSLSSYLEYAARRKVDTKCTVFIGTHYEYTCAQALLRLGFSLLRTGRKADAGIDLIGHWVLPHLREPFPVILQCKSAHWPMSPREVRELEGAFASVPAQWHKKDVLGLVVATSRASSGLLRTISQSPRPLGFIKITREGIVEQLLWNHAASERGLEGVGVTIRHTPNVLLPPPSAWTSATRKSNLATARKFFNDSTGTQKDIQLTWLGSPIFPTRASLAPETEELVKGLEEAPDIYAAKRWPKTRKSPPKRYYIPKPPRFTASGKKLGRPPGAKDLKPRATGPRAPRKKKTEEEEVKTPKKKTRKKAKAKTDGEEEEEEEEEEEIEAENG